MRGTGQTEVRGLSGRGVVSQEYILVGVAEGGFSASAFGGVVEGRFRVGDWLGRGGAKTDKPEGSLEYRILSSERAI